MFVLKQKYFCLALGLIVATVASAGSGEYRIFTDLQGREIKAKILKLNPGGKITVERDNRKRVTVSPTIFSEADQAYIKEWAAAGAFQSNSKFKISIKQEKNEIKKNVDAVTYAVKLDNRTNLSLDDVRVEYCMFVKVSGFNGEKDSQRTITGSLDFGQLNVGDSKEVETPAEQLITKLKSYTYQEEVEYQYVIRTYTRTGYKKSTEDKLKGFWIKVYGPTVGGEQITRDYCTPSGIDKKFTWPSKEF